MKKCPNCNAKLLIDHSFCPECGFDLRVKRVNNLGVETQEMNEILELTPPPIPQNNSQDHVNFFREKPHKQRMFSKLFSFDGRIRRTEYAISFIVYALISPILYVVIESGEFPILVFPYLTLFGIILAQGAKRSHDLGKSGWMQFLPLYVLWLVFEKGDNGINKYGKNPKN